MPVNVGKGRPPSVFGERKWVIKTFGGRIVGVIHESPADRLLKIKRAIRESPLRYFDINFEIRARFCNNFGRSFGRFVNRAYLNDS